MMAKTFRPECTQSSPFVVPTHSGRHRHTFGPPSTREDENTTAELLPAPRYSTVRYQNTWLDHLVPLPVSSSPIVTPSFPGKLSSPTADHSEDLSPRQHPISMEHIDIENSLCLQDKSAVLAEKIVPFGSTDLTLQSTTVELDESFAHQSDDPTSVPDMDHLEDSALVVKRPQYQTTTSSFPRAQADSPNTVDSLFDSSSILFEDVQILPQICTPPIIRDCSTYEQAIIRRASAELASPTKSELAAVEFEFHNQMSNSEQCRPFEHQTFGRALADIESSQPRREQYGGWNQTRGRLQADTTFSHGIRNANPDRHSVDESNHSFIAAGGCNTHGSHTGSEVELFTPISTALHPVDNSCDSLDKDVMLQEDMQVDSQVNMGSGKATPQSAVGYPSPSRSNASLATHQKRAIPFLLSSSPSAFTDRATMHEMNHEHDPLEMNEAGIAREIRNRPLPRPRTTSMLSQFQRTPIYESLISDKEDSPAPEPFALYHSGSSTTSTEPLLTSQRANHSVVMPMVSPAQRPDTPRPRFVDAFPSVRESVEREIAPPPRIRHSTPAYEDRSPTPSPVSHIGERIASGTSDRMELDTLDTDDLAMGEGCSWPHDREEARPSHVPSKKTSHQPVPCSDPCTPSLELGAATHTSRGEMTTGIETTVLQIPKPPPIPDDYSPPSTTTTTKPRGQRKALGVQGKGVKVAKTRSVTGTGTGPSTAKQVQTQAQRKKSRNVTATNATRVKQRAVTTAIALTDTNDCNVVVTPSAVDTSSGRGRKTTTTTTRRSARLVGTRN